MKDSDRGHPTINPRCPACNGRILTPEKIVPFSCPECSLDLTTEYAITILNGEDGEESQENEDDEDE